MSYTGNNPKFDSTLLRDLLSTVVTSPPSGYIKRLVRYGKSYLRSALGVESQIGKGEGRNYCLSPSVYLAAASAAALGWFVSGGTPTTITSGLPRESDLSAIQYVSASAGDYIRYRFKSDDADISRRLQAIFSQISIFGDYKLQVFSGTDAALSGATEIIMQSIYTNTSGVTNLPTGTTDIVSNVDINTRQFYEVRWTALAGSKTLKISGVNIGSGNTAVAANGDYDSLPVTVTGTWTANATYTAWETKRGRWAEYVVRVAVSVGAPTPGGAGLNISLPAGRTIDTSLLGSTLAEGGNRIPFSSVGINDTGVGGFSGTVYYINNTTVAASAEDSAATNVRVTAVTTTLPISFNNGDFVLMYFKVPIVEFANSVISPLNPNAQSPIRAGTVQAFAGATTPQGWLDCDGSLKLRDQYPQLYAQIGDAWAACINPLTGSANTPAPSGSQFRVPDLRGAFVRGAGGPNAAGVTTALGGYQADTTAVNGLANSASSISGGTGGPSSDGLNGFVGNRTPVNGTGTIFGVVSDDGFTDYPANCSAGLSNHTHGVSGTAAAQGMSGNPETRPDNVGLRMIIKAWDESFNLAGGAMAGLNNAGFASSEFASAEQDLGTVTWGGTAPSGTITKKYKWNKVGKLITFEFRIEASVAGSANAQVLFDLPADVPVPKTFSTSLFSTWQGIGTGGIVDGPSASLNSIGTSAVYRGAGGNWVIYAYSGPPAGVAAKFSVGTISWLTT